jgi:hypothetical protein
MKIPALIALAFLGASLFTGCSKPDEDSGGPKPGETVGKDGKPLTAEQIKNAPPPDGGAFDGVPGGPGGGKKKGPK